MNRGTTIQPITRLQTSEWQESWTVLKQRGGRNVPIIYPAIHASMTSRIIITWRARSCQYVWHIVSWLRHEHDHVSTCDKSYHDYVTYTIMSVCVTHCIMITSHTRSCQYARQIVSLRHVHDRVSVYDKSYHRYMACTIMSVCVTNRIIITSRIRCQYVSIIISSCAWSC